MRCLAAAVACILLSSGCSGGAVSPALVPIPAPPPVNTSPSPPPPVEVLAISEAGVGPFRLGMTGEDLLAMAGARRAEPDCPCAYNVRFEERGISVQIGQETACGVWIDNPATVGLAGTVRDAAAVYGEPWLEPATGDVRFQNAMWLAVFVGALEDNILTGDEPILAALVGGCGE